MALAITKLTQGSIAGSLASITTASVTPASNGLLLLNISIRNGASINPTAPTVSGNGLTWVQVDTANHDNSSASRRSIYVFRAMGASPSTGAITVTFGETETDAAWVLDQWTGTDTSGTNGSGAIVQHLSAADPSGSASSLSLTLGAITSGNGVWGAFGTDGSATPTAGSGLTLLGNIASASNESAQSEYALVGQTTVNMSFSGAILVAGVAIEVKAAAAAGTTIRQLASLGVGV